MTSAYATRSEKHQVLGPFNEGEAAEFMNRFAGSGASAFEEWSSGRLRAGKPANFSMLCLDRIQGLGYAVQKFATCFRAILTLLQVLDGNLVYFCDLFGCR